MKCLTTTPFAVRACPPCGGGLRDPAARFRRPRGSAPRRRVGPPRRRRAREGRAIPRLQAVARRGLAVGDLRGNARRPVAHATGDERLAVSAAGRGRRAGRAWQRGRLPGRLCGRRRPAQGPRPRTALSRLYGGIGQPGAGAGGAESAESPRAAGMAGLPPRPATQRVAGLAAGRPGVRRLGLCVRRAPQARAGQAQGTLARVEPGGHGVCAGGAAVGEGAGRRSGIRPGAGVREALPELQRRPGGRRSEVRRRRVLLHPRRRGAEQGRRGGRRSLRPRSGSIPTAR